MEPDRREEFERASDARRAAWVWRRYVTAARNARATALEVRYEELADDPVSTARELAAAPRRARETHWRPRSAVPTERPSGGIADDLTEEQLEDVLAEAGELLRELGYDP